MSRQFKNISAFMSGNLLCNVWSHNLRQMFPEFMLLSQYYRIVIIDAEYPGIIMKAVGSFDSLFDKIYAHLRMNVGSLKPIQIGISLFDENGNTPFESYTTWQFNFNFDLRKDKSSKKSIDLLKTAGVDFNKHARDGINPCEFAELMLSSGFLQREDVTFVSFHGGYDFAYLLKILTNKPLPIDRHDFFQLLQKYFPVLYDLKCIMKCAKMYGGLEGLARKIGVKREGQAHQAGSDALLTGKAFFKLKKINFKKGIENDFFNGLLWGLGGPYAILLPSATVARNKPNQHNPVNSVVLYKPPEILEPQPQSFSNGNTSENNPISHTILEGVHNINSTFTWIDNDFDNGIFVTQQPETYPTSINTILLPEDNFPYIAPNTTVFVPTVFQFYGLAPVNIACLPQLPVINSLEIEQQLLIPATTNLLEQDGAPVLIEPQHTNNQKNVSGIIKASEPLEQNLESLEKDFNLFDIPHLN